MRHESRQTNCMQWIYETPGKWEAFAKGSMGLKSYKKFERPGTGFPASGICQCYFCSKYDTFESRCMKW